MLARLLPLWASHYFGIPFIDRGVTRDGCDCWGLCRLVILEQTGLKLPKYPEIGCGATLAKLRTILAAADGPDWIEIERGQERAFDLVLMRGQFEHEGRKYSRPIHVGIAVQPGMLMHIEQGSEVTIVGFDHPRIRRRITQIYRHHKLA